MDFESENWTAPTQKCYEPTYRMVLEIKLRRIIGAIQWKSEPTYMLFNLSIEFIFLKWMLNKLDFVCAVSALVSYRPKMRNIASIVDGISIFSFLHVNEILEEEEKVGSHTQTREPAQPNSAIQTQLENVRQNVNNKVSFSGTISISPPQYSTASICNKS